MASSSTPLLPASAGEITRKKITLTNAVGEVLVGTLDDTCSREIVILCHGFRGSKEFVGLINVSSALCGLGFSTYRFDFSGNGESQGEFRFGNYWKEVDDLHSVVLYWIGQGRLVKAIVGHSQGGNVVLLYASKYSDVLTVVNLSARFDLKRGLKERFGEFFFQNIEEKGYMDIKDKSGSIEYRVTMKSLMDRLSIDMESAVLSLPKMCRVLTVHGSKDESIPVEDAFELDRLIANHKLIVIDGADHLYTNHQKQLAAVVAEFI
eukprot:c53344_g1_i1 orf=335-1126(-)